MDGGASSSVWRKRNVDGGVPPDRPFLGGRHLFQENPMKIADCDTSKDYP